MFAHTDLLASPLLPGFLPQSEEVLAAFPCVPVETPLLFLLPGHHDSLYGPGRRFNEVFWEPLKLPDL